LKSRLVRRYRGYRVEITSETDNGLAEAVATVQLSDADDIITLLTVPYENRRSGLSRYVGGSKKKNRRTPSGEKG